MTEQQSQKQTPDYVGFEWEEALNKAAKFGIELEQRLTAPPHGKTGDMLRVVRQQVVSKKHILCTCVAEAWDDDSS